jgi:hypothetical protein
LILFFFKFACFPDEQQRKRAIALAEATSRAAALVVTVTTIIIDYKFQSWKNSRLEVVSSYYRLIKFFLTDCSG